MSGISTTVGPFSGINTAQLIEQILAAESRPVQLAQGRLAQLQLQQTAVLDINTRLGTLRDAAAAFRVNKTFKLATATTSDEKTLTASASTGAVAGTYQFIVDRLVTTQQRLSRGFTDRNSTGIGATSFSFETTKARLDRDVSLSDLNGGSGVQRGKIVITDADNKTATIDLSKAATMNEALEAINGNGTVPVTASVQDGKIVLTHGSGKSFTVSNASGSTTADSLGISGSSTVGGKLTGSTVYSMSALTTLASLNDGNGVSVKSVQGTNPFNFSIAVTTAAETKNVNVNLGEVYELKDGKFELKEGAVTTVEGAIKRINDAMTAAGVTGVQASIGTDGARLRLSDSSGTVTNIAVTENPTLGDTTARDLGLVGGTFAGGTLTGKRVFAGLNTTLASKLNGGSGIGGDGTLNITARDGNAFSVSINRDGTLTEIADAIQTASGTGVNGKPRLSVSVNSKGTGLLVTDNTGSTTSNLIINGTSGSDTASSLGISTGAGGVASATYSGNNLQHQYISRATTLDSLNNGAGIGTGKFRITDGFGATVLIDIGTDSKTMGQVIDEINSQATSAGLKLKASINDTGDGLVIAEDVGTGSAGALKIKVADESGTVAASLEIAGVATGVGADNKVNGSFERKVTFSASDTLEAVARKINEASAGMTAAIIKDGGGAAPFRLSLTATSSGRDGRVLIDTGALDLGLTTLEAGEDSRVFFGATDPAKGVLLTGSSNSLDSVVSGVNIDLKGVSASPVTLSVTTDTDGIEKAIDDFIKAFNGVAERIDQQTSYNAETRAKGPLLGDGATSSLRTSLFQALQSPNRNVTGRYTRLVDVGVGVGEGGRIEFDKDRFREAMAEDPEAVEALFTARVQDASATTIDLGNGITATNPNASSSFSSLGVLGQIEELAKRYVDTTSGVWTAKKNATDDLIESQQERISSLNAKLLQRRDVLQAQFIRMEQAIAQLQTQSSALASIG